ncbi:hypothetical protein RQM47_12515 [Rubrivirga sp. S365]|uniref:YcxB-like protein n=1 Tax=Rubrivirga litoralis TaxID=3075598 RepID=A0ABU3BUF7_9BACT|nr:MULTISPECIES: hypothetical protein [unclassified Rubrivirga]MDT0632920.1 hypothetical protein [Rubrivirga sp. F394]MDT7857468.1 hypothetical protein [Rubrivirga sp. S365]
MTRDVFAETVLHGTRERRRTAQTRLAGYAVITLAAALAWWWFVGGGGLFFVAAGYFAVVAALYPTLARRRARAAGAGRSDIGRAVTARVTEADLVVDVEGVSHAAYRLDALHAAEPRDEGVLVELFPSEVVWLPDGAFADRPARTAFERALLAGARLPDPAL